MTAIREFLRLIRLAQATLSVRHYEAAVEREKIGLAKALSAKDKAMAELRIAEGKPTPEPPTYLRTPINRKRELQRIAEHAREGGETALRG